MDVPVDNLLIDCGFCSRRIKNKKKSIGISVETRARPQNPAWPIHQSPVDMVLFEIRTTPYQPNSGEISQGMCIGGCLLHPTGSWSGTMWIFAVILLQWQHYQWLYLAGGRECVPGYVPICPRVALIVFTVLIVLGDDLLVDIATGIEERHNQPTVSPIVPGSDAD